MRVPSNALETEKRGDADRERAASGGVFLPKEGVGEGDEDEWKMGGLEVLPRAVA